MFSYKHRLSARCFEELLKTGKIVYQGNFKLTYLNSPTLKIAVVVPKKVGRLSVTRHRIKRIVVSVLKKINNLPKTGSYIVFVQKNMEGLKVEEISTELNELFGKIR